MVWTDVKSRYWAFWLCAALGLVLGYYGTLSFLAFLSEDWTRRWIHQSFNELLGLPAQNPAYLVPVYGVIIFFLAFGAASRAISGLLRSQRTKPGTMILALAGALAGGVVRGAVLLTVDLATGAFLLGTVVQESGALYLSAGLKEVGFTDNFFQALLFAFSSLKVAAGAVLVAGAAYGVRGLLLGISQVRTEQWGKGDAPGRFSRWAWRGTFSWGLASGGSLSFQLGPNITGIGSASDELAAEAFEHLPESVALPVLQESWYCDRFDGSEARRALCRSLLLAAAGAESPSHARAFSLVLFDRFRGWGDAESRRERNLTHMAATLALAESWLKFVHTREGRVACIAFLRWASQYLAAQRGLIEEASGEEKSQCKAALGACVQLAQAVGRSALGLFPLYALGTPLLTTRRNARELVAVWLHLHEATNNPALCKSALEGLVRLDPETVNLAIAEIDKAARGDARPQ